MPVRNGQSLSGSIRPSIFNKLERTVASHAKYDTARSTFWRHVQAHVVRIKNGSGVDLARGEILSWDGVLYDDSADNDDYFRRVTFDGVTPAFPDDCGKVAVLLHAIDDGDIGKAAISGIAPAFVNVVTEGDPYCYLTNGSSSNLTSGTSGDAQIIQTAGGTGRQLCYVNLDQSQHLWLAERQADDSDLIFGLDGEGTGVAVTVQDPLSMFTDLAEDDLALVKQVGADFYYVQAPCS